MKVLFLLMVMGLLSFSVGADVSEAQIKEAMKWKALAPSMEKILNQHGWWKPETIYLMQGAVVLVNKQLIDPAAMIIRGRDIASLQTPSVEIASRKHCLLTKSQVKGEMAFKYDQKTESGNCWVAHAADVKSGTQKHTYVKVRSILKGSKAFSVESALISTNILKGQKGPSSVAIKIAKSVGAK